LNKEAQFKVCKKIIFDFGLLENFSRLDSSSHPFCTTISSDDVRITTRFDEQDLLSAVSSTMHELGHALYERNLPKQWRGTALGEVYSLGLHESQSRIIENCIGRSKHFQEYLSKILFDFGGVKYSSEYLYNATNWVEKSFIRVDADEVTYSLHVLIRLKLEILLLNNELSVDDLPSVWNQMYSKYLNITPSSNKVGVLQDVHWYSGAFGYFSTYVLGNIYNGAMLYKLNQDIPNYLLDLENGNFSKVTSWLKSNVHDHGSKYSPRELLGRILNVRNPKNYIPTGNEFINYLESK
jgi:carboxypeptidase Taq